MCVFCPSSRILKEAYIIKHSLTQDWATSPARLRDFSRSAARLLPFGCASSAARLRAYCARLGDYSARLRDYSARLRDYSARLRDLSTRLRDYSSSAVVIYNNFNNLCESSHPDSSGVVTRVPRRWLNAVYPLRSCVDTQKLCT